MQTGRGFTDATEGFFREDSFLDPLMTVINYLYHGGEYIKHLFKNNLDRSGFPFKNKHIKAQEPD